MHEQFAFIHREIQNLANGNVGASDLQQVQPLVLRILAKERGIALLQEEQGMCKHILDAASCKDEDAEEASGQLLNHDVYTESAVISECVFSSLNFHCKSEHMEVSSTLPEGGDEQDEQHKKLKPSQCHPEDRDD